MQRLCGKTVLVTGATGSIGSAIARELADDGAKVLLHFAQNHHAAETLADEIGGGAMCLSADLSDPAGANQLWADALNAAGDISALVNNAGILSHTSVDDPLAEWQAVWAREMQINLFATADLCRAAIQHFRGNGVGRIVNITSRAAHGGYRGDAMPYGASKAALVNLTQSIAGSFGGDGITAVALAPGWVCTDMSEAFFAEHGAKAALSGIPIGTMAEPSEIVGFVLRSSQPSLSGPVIDINGASQMR